VTDEKNKVNGTPQETAEETTAKKDKKISADSPPGENQTVAEKENEISEKAKTATDGAKETPKEHSKPTGEETEKEQSKPTGEEEIRSLQNRLLDSQCKIEKIAKELDETKNIFRRTVAEYENYRKRTAKEKTEIYENGMISAVESLLPIIDTLEMALAAPTQDENFKKGVEMTLTAAKTALEKLGVEEIDAINKPFDPNIHAAISRREVEGLERGIVVDQFQKGYRTKTKIIRHASVIVSC
jgi:molecular chaperone GrpE